MQAKIQDAHIRQQALDPTKSFIVQAPAGSGKTELLTQRYLILLAHAQKAPEEIIAITFTRKAAAEMRARILESLALGQQSEPNKNDYRHTTWSLAQSVLKKDAALHWNLLRNPNRLRILTIDALSAFICRQTPMLTQFGATPSVCDNAKPLYQLAARKLLTEISSHEKWKNHVEHLLLHLDNDVEKLEKLFTHLLDHRDQWLSHIMYAYTHHQTLRELLNASLKRIIEEKIMMAAKAVPTHLKQTLLLLAQHAGNYFKENNPDNALSHCADFYFEKKDLSQFPAWFAFANLFLTKEGGWRKSIDIRTGFGPKDPNKSLMLAVLLELNECAAFKECLQDIQSAPPAIYTDTQWETVYSLTQLLPLLAAQLTVIFQEKGQVDFIELNLSALKALGSDESPTDLALYLDYQIHHLLIDEFQDTSVVHLHLLEKIIAGWQPNDGRTLFLVGDPMQSIYRFRNAEVGLFLRAQQQGIGNITLEPLTLTMNFRSQKNLVTWFNDTFGAVFPAVSDIATGRVPYTPAIAARADIKEQNAQWHPIVDGNNEDEAKIIAEKILEIKHNYPSDSIALLVRSRLQLIPIIQLLQTHQISFQAIDIEPLAQRPEIQDLLSLTRALLHRADRIAWLSLLRAPFCGLTLNDLEIIAITAEKITIWEVILETEKCATLSENGLLRIQQMRFILQNAFDQQGQLSLSAWIEQSWIALNGPACLSHEAELDYARAYFNLIEKMESDANTFSIEELNEQCKKLFANAKSSTNNPIQILTIHKSKGLEFDHVFLPGLHRQPPASSEKLLRWFERVNAFGGDDLILAPIKSITHQSDPIYDYLKSIENQKQDYEITRLLYVAATRAKKSLHLFSITQTNALPKKGSFFEKLWPVYESQASQWHPIQKNTLTENKNEIGTLLSRLPIDWYDVKNPPQKPKPIYINLDVHSPYARAIGTAVHMLFQTIAKTGNKKISVSRSYLLSLGLLPGELRNAVETIHTIIGNALSDERGQWILSNTHQEARCEWALTYTHENNIEHYVIDRSFIDKNNTRWIIDYKTSKPKEDESMDDFLHREKQAYESQLNKYADILAKMENRPIKLGLYFPLCNGWIEIPWANAHDSLQACEVFYNV